MSRVAADAGAGQRGVTYAFTNASSADCTLRGYPEVTPNGGDGQPLPRVSAVHAEGTYFHGRTAPGTVTLAPGAQATFEISFTGIPADNRPCVRSDSVAITAPGTTHALTLADRLTICVARQLRVTPVQPATAALVGRYADTLPAADAAARVVTLRLDSTQAAELQTRYVGTGRTLSQHGRWSVHDSVLTVRLTGASPLVYIVGGGYLRPIAWDTAVYGRAGLPLSREP